MDEKEKQDKEISSVTQENAKHDSSDSQAELKPAMPELGSTPCPVCKRRVTVFVTKNQAPLHQLRFLCGTDFLQRLGCNPKAEATDEEDKRTTISNHCRSL